jgi:hypothetical protein
VPRGRPRQACLSSRGGACRPHSLRLALRGVGNYSRKRPLVTRRGALLLARFKRHVPGAVSAGPLVAPDLARVGISATQIRKVPVRRPTLGQRAGGCGRGIAPRGRQVQRTTHQDAGWTCPAGPVTRSPPVSVPQRCLAAAAARRCVAALPDRLCHSAVAQRTPSRNCTQALKESKWRGTMTGHANGASGGARHGQGRSHRPGTSDAGFARPADGVAKANLRNEDGVPEES